MAVTRWILCGNCAARKNEGTRLAYQGSAIGEPAEYERVLKGIARQPQAEQRYVSINGERHTMTLDFYNCDTCNAEIRPGEPAGTWSVWTEEQAGRIPDWEQEYIIVGEAASS